jgi:hypothetical protein
MEALSRWLALQRAATVLAPSAHVLAAAKIAGLSRVNAQSQARQKRFFCKAKTTAQNRARSTQIQRQASKLSLSFRPVDHDAGHTEEMH